MSARVQCILAGAGSGKTFRIANLVADAIAAGRCRPRALLATTFTRRAARTLRERIAACLAARGELAAAQQVEEARIETVHGCCGAWVSEHAFELGLAADLSVLDEPAARAALAAIAARALDAATDDDRVEATVALVLRAESLGVDGAALAEDLADDVPWPPEDAALPGMIAHAYDALFDSAGGITSRQGHESLSRAREVRAGLDADLVGLVDLDLAAQDAPAAHRALATLRGLAARARSLPSLQRATRQARDDVRRAVAETLPAWRAWKRAAGCIDFADQERLALALFREHGLGESLRGELDLVVVDEFQDTAPTQLALFEALAEVAAQSVWVGDPKQSIYGFRGAVPAWTVDAVRRHAQGAPVERLDRSWRSRPLLVHVTSSVFSAAFARTGMPREDVALSPAAPDERTRALGPCFERWHTDGGAGETAAHVDALLRDDGVRVRDERGQARRVAPRDVAVLCRTRARCRAMTRALRERGIAVQGLSGGLLDEVEVIAALAGLRLWWEPDAALPAQEIARILDEDPDGGGWLTALLADAEHPRVTALRERRAIQPSTSLPRALLAVIDALDLRTRCAAWPDGAARRANLDALVARAEGFERASGAAPSVPSFLAHLDALAASGADALGASDDADAVTVCTWHASKGLEWPVVVLTDLGHAPEAPVFGVSHAVDGGRVRVRWVQDPFGVAPDHPVWSGAFDAEARRRARDDAEAESLRLLYVAWTRARDRLVLAGSARDWQRGVLSLLSERGVTLLPEPEANGVAWWAGRKVDVCLRRAALDLPPRPRAPARAPRPPEAAPRPLRWTLPSSLDARAEVAQVERLGGPLPLRGPCDLAALGRALHRLLAADADGWSPEEGLRAARALLHAESVLGAFDPREAVAALHRWRRWLRASGATVSPEHPIALREQGLRGKIDAALWWPDGVGVVDHKSFVGAADAVIDRAADVGGQLAAYAHALSAEAGLPLRGAWVHLPLAGCVVRLAISSPP